MSFLANLDEGRLRWDLLTPFPRQEAADRARGDAAEAGVAAILAGVDPEEIDRTRTLPAGLVDALRAGGWYALPVAPDDGGMGLSAYNVFRVVERAARFSPAVGLTLGVQNCAGAGALLPALPPGALRDFVRRRAAAGVPSGWADTEPAGHNNAVPGTTATLTPDGEAYLLHGEKVFIGNGSVAQLLVVTAMAGAQVCLCFVDTTDRPGFRVRSKLDFLGVHALPNGALSFDGVRVPRELVLTAAEGDIRQSPLISGLVLLGRHTMMCAPALAIARQCLDVARIFLPGRRIDGRPLSGYDQIQRAVAENLADVFAIESVVAWNLLGDGAENRWFDRFAGKNIATLAAWRVADRTVSLLGGEGGETAASKQRRGAAPLPAERLLRDARMLRIAGGVDFQADFLAGRLLLSRYLGPADRRPPAQRDGPTPQVAGLGPANRAHLDAVGAELRRLTLLCRHTAGRYDSVAELVTDEQTVMVTGALARELLAMSTVLARAAAEPESAPLADVYCTGAQHRLAGLWRRLPAAGEPDYAAVSHAWLTARAEASRTR